MGYHHAVSPVGAMLFRPVACLIAYKETKQPVARRRISPTAMPTLVQKNKVPKSQLVGEITHPAVPTSSAGHLHRSSATLPPPRRPSHPSAVGSPPVNCCAPHRRRTDSDPTATRPP